MEVKKESQAVAQGTPTKEQLAKINGLAKAQLTEEQVYVFSVRLCDDQVDRDLERFDGEALPELARMFVGKSGIVDHMWSAQGQMARIFETTVEKRDGVNFIKAWAYIRRGGAGDEWIADIEAGIKKEVSVGCAMGRRVCSICGGEYGQCGHQKGEIYDGETCVAVLKEPMDAYEFSFVAVPAQPEAGVLKTMARGKEQLKALADQFGAGEEYRKLFQLAKLGEKYEGTLRSEVVKMCLMLDLGMEAEQLRAMAEKMTAQELESLKMALENRVSRMYPVKTQLAQVPQEGQWDSGYVI